MKQTQRVQYMDVKEVSEVVDELRGQTKTMIRQYKAWQQRRQAVLLKSSYLLMEDDLLREQIHEMFRLYRQMHKEYHRLYRHAIAGLSQTGAPDSGAPMQEEPLCA